MQGAMRHSSPETKRHYQLGMVEQVREGIEKASKEAYNDPKSLRIYYVSDQPKKQAAKASASR